MFWLDSNGVKMSGMNRNIFIGMVLLLCSMFSGTQAADERPDTLMQSITDQMMEKLLQEDRFLSENPEQAYKVSKKLVNEIILPHLNMRLMSHWIIGKNWKKATAEQRNQFVEKFTSMLVRTYAGAMLQFRGSSVTIEPIDPDLIKKNTTVVRTEFINSHGVVTPVLFRVRKGGSGEWKVFDMIVDGVSLVKNYRSNFSAVIRKVGISGLIKRLEKQRS